MNAQKLLMVALLMTIFSILSISLGTYSLIQKAMSLEGNDLYSNRSVAVDETGPNLRSALKTAHADARVFSDLTDDGSIRAVMETGTPDSIPLHAGRQFKDSDARAALVGADVEVANESGQVSYIFAGTSYPVVGYLGLSDNSLISNVVLLKGAPILEADSTVRMIVDGPTVEKRLSPQITYHPIAAANGGTDRRTNIDYVSPILLRFGWTLTALGGIATGLLAASHQRRYARIRFQVGRVRHAVLARGIARLLTWAVPPLLVTFCVAWLASPPIQATSTILLHTIAPAVLILSVFTLASAWNLWRRPSWS